MSTTACLQCGSWQLLYVWAGQGVQSTLCGKYLLAVAEYCGVLLSCVASVFALHPRPTNLCEDTFSDIFTIMLHLFFTFALLKPSPLGGNYRHNENITNTQNKTTHTSSPSQQRWNKKKTKQMMDVTFVLEESGVTATVEVPCEADVAAAKGVACTALAVWPASVEMRIGTQVLEGTCRLQDTAFDSGVQVVLACRFADIKCPAECSIEVPPGTQRMYLHRFSLSPCGALCLCTHQQGYVTGLDTETFSPAFKFKVDFEVIGAPAISRCKTRCYLPCKEVLLDVALPGGEVLRKVDGPSFKVFARGGVVVSKGKDGVSVYDEDLTLLRSLSHQMCGKAAVSDCGGWVITSSNSEDNARLWDVNTGEAVACVPADGWACRLAISRSASVFAVVQDEAQLYDWSGAALRSIDVCVDEIVSVQFTPCGKYLVVYGEVLVPDDDEDGDEDGYDGFLHQYDVATMSCVRVISQESYVSFAISPCSRVVVGMQPDGVIVTRHLYPHNSE